MEEEYCGSCFNCNVETQVLVIDEEEIPLYCSMCGAQMDFDLLED